MKVRSWPIRPDHRLTAQVVAGRYRLDDLLGRGGAADVYEGLDLRLRRPVAVKVFRPDGEAGTEDHFDSEGRLLARLQHPGLITVYDSGREDGTPYLVMELIRGTTLRRRIAASPLTPTEACRIGSALASALAHVHAAGVVHRDVKPANILLDETDVPHLTDFGISRLLDTTARTVTGALVGTAAYMSPEQVLGKGAGPAADIYSLGLVLLESMKGELEYDGAPLEAAIARLHRPPVLPPGLPAPLAELLEAMTEVDEHRRPDARTCARALAVAAPEDDARPVPAPAPVARVGVPGRPGPDALPGPDAFPEPDALEGRAGRDGRVTTPARVPASGPGARRGGRALLSAGAALAALGVGLTGSIGAAGDGRANAAAEPARPSATKPDPGPGTTAPGTPPGAGTTPRTMPRPVPAQPGTQSAAYPATEPAASTRAGDQDGQGSQGSRGKHGKHAKHGKPGKHAVRDDAEPGSVRQVKAKAKAHR
ncbi:serine/threonine-protein kinase [Streptomyces ficellus]|uniref:non-specific serine/threonine protein kinase n=1 Tax=Streptomyces ficellus TaxID=1977088 RepID=A0A6I6FNW9_9ACTN|nr:serine/threonine-protein kinase [Streptomyces ficellus]QGV82012.1 serine/threonine protein kinase [Streptomyces ficellus]